MDLCTEFHRLLITIRIFYSDSITKPLAKIDEGGAEKGRENLNLKLIKHLHSINGHNKDEDGL